MSKSTKRSKEKVDQINSSYEHRDQGVSFLSLDIYWEYREYSTMRQKGGGILVSSRLVHIRMLATRPDSNIL